VYVNADDYQRWIDIGMALKHGFGDAGYAIWDRWSARSGKYPGGEETRRRWGTFNPTGALKLGTVFELAKQGGWTPPRAPRKSKQSGKPSGPPGMSRLQAVVKVAERRASTTTATSGRRSSGRKGVCRMHRPGRGRADQERDADLPARRDAGARGARTRRACGTTSGRLARSAW
jgi:hypothetical protein